MLVQTLYCTAHFCDVLGNVPSRTYYGVSTGIYICINSSGVFYVARYYVLYSPCHQSLCTSSRLPCTVQSILNSFKLSRATLPIFIFNNVRHDNQYMYLHVECARVKE